MPPWLTDPVVKAEKFGASPGQTRSTQRAFVVTGAGVGIGEVMALQAALVPINSENQSDFQIHSSNSTTRSQL
jgi:hypothetical protein